jgi:hypothetical protein
MHYRQKISLLEYMRDNQPVRYVEHNLSFMTEFAEDRVHET